MTALLAYQLLTPNTGPHTNFMRVHAIASYWSLVKILKSTGCRTDPLLLVSR